jgi:hypothetical protein
VQCSPNSRQFIPHWSKYSSQHPSTWTSTQKSPLWFSFCIYERLYYTQTT